MSDKLSSTDDIAVSRRYPKLDVDGKVKSRSKGLEFITDNIFCYNVNIVISSDYCQFNAIKQMVNVS